MGKANGRPAQAQWRAHYPRTWLKVRRPARHSTQQCSSKTPPSSSSWTTALAVCAPSSVLAANANTCSDDTCSYEEVLKPLGFVITCIQDNDVAVKPRQGMEKIARWKRMAKPNQSGFSRVTLSTRFQRPQYAMKLSTSEMKTYTHYMEDSSSVLCVVIGNTVRYMFINISYMYCAKQFSAVSRCLLHS